MANSRVIRTFSIIGADGAGQDRPRRGALAHRRSEAPAGRGLHLAARRGAGGEEAELHAVAPPGELRGGRPRVPRARLPGLRRVPHRGRVGAAGDRGRGARHLGRRRRAQPGGAHLRRAGGFRPAGDRRDHPAGSRAGRLREVARRPRGLAQGEAGPSAAPDPRGRQVRRPRGSRVDEGAPPRRKGQVPGGRRPGRARGRGRAAPHGARRGGCGGRRRPARQVPRGRRRSRRRRLRAASRRAPRGSGSCPSRARARRAASGCASCSISRCGSSPARRRAR